MVYPTPGPLPVRRETLPGSLCEYNGHERLKSSLAFRWPGMAVVSGRMARADGVYIGLERPGLPGAGRSPGSAGGGSWLAHRSRIMLGTRGACLNLALWTRAMVAITRLLDGGTQCMSLSAATEHSIFQEQARPGRAARRSTASRCRKTQRHRRQQGCRRSSSTPSS